ncbi:MAG: hypothetical protein V2I33_22505 [Kangiellaceae bacterium]|jgi:hypothetical protein|nr:hypothetical protein [Kangiellaceae bacterium]
MFLGSDDLVSAKLSDDWDHLSVTFKRAINVTAYSNCNDVFTEETTAMFGVQAECFWEIGAKTIVAYLGAGATLKEDLLEF